MQLDGHAHVPIFEHKEKKETGRKIEMDDNSSIWNVDVPHGSKNWIRLESTTFNGQLGT